MEPEVAVVITSPTEDHELQAERSSESEYSTLYLLIALIVPPPAPDHLSTVATPGLVTVASNEMLVGAVQAVGVRDNSVFVLAFHAE
jgi:hypothetical protein